MKYLKLFENYNNEEKVIGCFKHDQFDEFTEAVYKWEQENGLSVPWALYPRPGSSYSYNVRNMWDAYVMKDGIFCLTQMQGKLIGNSLLDNGTIISIDNNDRRIERDRFDPGFETI